MAAEPASFSRGRLYGVVGAGILLAGALAYVGFVDPHRSGSVFPQCPFRLLTGWNCPACGGLRMIHDLLHGNLAAAVIDNVFLLTGIPVLAAWILLRRRSGGAVLPIPALVVAVGAAIAWTVLRNLSRFPLVPTALAW
jgi:hypothetical protein